MSQMVHLICLQVSHIGALCFSRSFRALFLYLDIVCFAFHFACLLVHFVYSLGTLYIF